MENSPQSSCCRCRPASPPKESRRGFLSRTGAWILGLFALAVPSALGIAAALNPLRQKGQGGDFFRVASLDALPEDGTPRKFPIIADRRDAWTLFPNEPIGSVWLRRVGSRDVKAMCVICPHAGCYIGYDAKTKPVPLPVPRGPLRPRRPAHGRLVAEPSRHGRARRGRDSRWQRGLGQVPEFPIRYP